MLKRNEHGVLQLDGDAFLAALDEGSAALERLGAMVEHITELAYHPDLAEFEDTFSDDVDRMKWDFALRVRKRRDGTWKIHGRGNVAWNVTPHWAPQWAGAVFPTLQEALADLPDAMAAHTDVCHRYLRVAAERAARRHQRGQEPEPEGGAHDCG